MTTGPPVIELEFVLDGRGFPLGHASAAAECTLEVELVVPRSDGSVLTYVDVDGAGAARVLRTLRADERVSEARRGGRPAQGTVLRFVAPGRPVTTLSDTGTVVTRFSATDGRARLVADVPPMVEPGDAIEAFTEAYPSAELVARRRTGRETPQLGQSQFVTRVLGEFTERQLHALRVAHDEGYFEWPRDCRADDVAAAIGISTPTFSQHLRAAERKLTGVLFEG